MTSAVEYVVLNGELAYDRSTDVRVQHLLEGIAPENTAPSGAIDGPVDVHAKEAEEHGEGDEHEDGDDDDKGGDDEEEEGDE